MRGRAYGPLLACCQSGAHLSRSSDHAQNVVNELLMTGFDNEKNNRRPHRFAGNLHSPNTAYFPSPWGLHLLA